jgi:hypothetical protein
MNHPLKVGQIVHLNTISDERHDKHLVLRVHEHGVETVRAEPWFNSCPVVFRLWENLSIPEQPKAEPGAVYMGPHGNRYVGLANGSITWIAAKPQPFDPAAFTKVEE